ncbi:MAG: carbamoyltransferase N-terminal domain-containing protein, partial [Verrucomicrobiota bacterium]
MKVLGFNYGHDASACVVVDGEIKAAIAEERLTRIKNDASFPIHSIRWCLEWAGLEDGDIDLVASAGQVLRLDARHFFDFPPNIQQGLSGLKSRMKMAFRDKFFPGIGVVQGELPLYCERIALRPDCQVVSVGHHLAHAASAYYTAGLGEKKALIVTMDGLGDHTSSALWIGENNRITPLRSYDRSSSVGWFYGNATEGLGWRHGSDEWKV